MTPLVLLLLLLYDLFHMLLFGISQQPRVMVIEVRREAGVAGVHPGTGVALLVVVLMRCAVLTLHRGFVVLLYHAVARLDLFTDFTKLVVHLVAAPALAMLDGVQLVSTYMAEGGPAVSADAALGLELLTEERSQLVDVAGFHGVVGVAVRQVFGEFVQTGMLLAMFLHVMLFVVMLMAFGIVVGVVSLDAFATTFLCGLMQSCAALGGAIICLVVRRVWFGSLTALFDETLF